MSTKLRATREEIVASGKSLLDWDALARVTEEAHEVQRMIDEINEPEVRTFTTA